MRINFYISFLLSPLFLIAQHTISGEFQPSGDFKWVILYQLDGMDQKYIANNKIEEGKFSFTLPNDAEIGMYRLVYDLQNQLYIDVLYNKEDIAFSANPFRPNAAIRFYNSEENRLFQKYLTAVNGPQYSVDSVQLKYFSAVDETEKKALAKAYKIFYNQVETSQKTYETSSKNTMAHHFIKAMARHNNPDIAATPQQYLEDMKSNYLNGIDVRDSILLRSNLIYQRIMNYIFMQTSDDPEVMAKAQKGSVAKVMEKIMPNPSLYKDVIEGLLQVFSQEDNTQLVRFILEQYYTKLPEESIDQKFKKELEAQLKTAIGSKAPPIVWQENGQEQRLYDLMGADYYVVVFWSSTCGHCLKEIPVLADFEKDKKNTKVVAIGLEEEESKAGWEDIIKDYPFFINIYGRGKWENPFAKTYAVHATPTYFILDKDKTIIAKPDTVGDLKVYFDRIN